VKVHFDDPQFDGQLLRALGYVYYGGADVGECLTTAGRIAAGDADGWYTAWSETAARLIAAADASLAAGHTVSAREAYLRASNYYRTAYIHLFGTPVDPRVVMAYDRQTAAFRAAAPRCSPAIEPVAIPYEGTTLPGYFIPAAAGDPPRPTLIATGGYDGTAEELYFAVAAVAVRRGYHCLVFDGPGQGGALVKQQLYMRPDWERVVTPVVDYLLTRPEVDPERIALFAGSLGGYLAPRAATAEHRLAACIADAALYDIGGASQEMLPPELRAQIAAGDPAVLAPVFARIMQDPTQAFVFKRGMWVHGVSTPWDYLRALAPYTLQGIAGQIRCPTFVAEAENDRRRGGGKQLYDALTCPHKQYVLFTAAEGAGEHCEAGAASLFHQRAFDWLDAVLGVGG
jgi:alpha-beta hydrolase superfamily lysophospholipase